jgi:hypothetical protein
MCAGLAKGRSVMVMRVVPPFRLDSCEVLEVMRWDGRGLVCDEAREMDFDKTVCGGL